jgi:hypothetical protein
MHGDTMAEVLTRSSVYVSGFWLLEAKALQDLDTILEEDWIQRQEVKKEAIEKVAKKIIDERKERKSYDELSEEDKKKANKEIRAEVAQQYEFSLGKREVVLTLASAKVLRYSTIAEILKDIAVKKEMPETLAIDTKCMSERCKIDIPASTNNSNIYVYVYPEDSPLNRSFVDQIEHWAERNRAPSWQCYWNQNFMLAWILFIVLLCVSWIGTTIWASYSTRKDAVRAEASTLLDQGLKTKEDETKALHLTLSLLAGHHQKQESPPPLWAWLPSLVGLVVAVVLSFPPKTVIGIGKGVDSIARWQCWIKLISYTVPVLILTGFIIPLARDYLKTLF